MPIESTLGDLLATIDASLQELIRLTVSTQNPATVTGAIADDRDLDSKFGDEVVRFVPRDWTGESFKGYAMSDCPPELLEMLAETYDYFAGKNEGILTDKGKPKSDFDRRSARRARGWAKRLRDGYKPRATTPEAAAPEPAPHAWADEGGFERPTVDEDVPF